MIKEISQDYYPSMIEYERLGHPDQEKPPILEVNPSPDNPMWILVNMLNSIPNSKLVHIEPRAKRKHVAVWILPDGIEIIDNAWGNPEFKALSNTYNSSFYNCAPRLRVSENSLSDTSSKRDELISRGRSLPTPDSINSLVRNIVDGVKSGKV